MNYDFDEVDYRCKLIEKGIDLGVVVDIVLKMVVSYN